jgi:hypothetical protein
MSPHPSFASSVLAIISVMAVIADFAALRSLLNKPESAAKSPLQPLDMWSESRFGVWWACRLTLWSFYAFFIAYTGSVSGGFIGMVFVVTQATRDIGRSWQ